MEAPFFMVMKGYLHLEDGLILEGNLYGGDSDVFGEVVFSTGMTGYPQSLTDPSFAGQILVFTYPIVGNYGVPSMQLLAEHLAANFESEQIWVNGIVISSLTQTPSHSESVQTLAQWCKAFAKPILADIDTRMLTCRLREHGVLRGKISTSPNKVSWQNPFVFDYHQVSIKKPIEYVPERKNGKHIALIDCGVKHGIIRALMERGFSITRIPHDVNPYDIHTKYDGIFCSNGPGDPKDWQTTIENIRIILTKHIPFLGVCLGHQLLALAVHADTYKLKYGHRGINQPCQDTLTKKCYLTSQNHGYAVKSDTIPKAFTSWFINLNDGTNEGMISNRSKIWTCQFHPEGNPGPFDTDWIFNKLNG